MANSNLTELLFIIDRSGSMSGLESDTIGGFNSMINKWKGKNCPVVINTIPELPTLYHSIDFLTVILQHLPYNIYRLLIFFLILGSDSCFLRANF